MEKIYKIPLDKDKGDEINNSIEELNELLERRGISFFIEETNMCIRVDQELYKKQFCRNAGPPVLELSSTYTCGEIRKLRETMSVQEISQHLGVSRTTFFRIWNDNLEKEADELFLNEKGKRNRTDKKI